MGTRRVFQVAKEFNISNEALISFLADRKFPVKNQMSLITEEMYDQVQKKYGKTAGKEGDVSEEVSFRRRLREKKLEEEKRKEREREELQAKIRAAYEVKVTPKKSRRKEPSKEEVLKIAELEAKAQAQKEIRKETETRGRKEALREAMGLEAPEKEEVVETRPAAPAAETETDSKKAEATEASQPSEQEGVAEPKKPEQAEEQTGAVKPAADEQPTRKKAKGKKKAKEEEKKEEATPEKAEQPAAEEGKKKKRKKKRKKTRISEEEIEASIKQTLAAMSDTGKSKRRKRKLKGDEEQADAEESNTITVTEFISAADLAKLMDVEPSEVIKKCLELGMMISINQRLDMDTIIAVADEFGFDVEQEEEFAAMIEDDDEADNEEDLVPRPPVVTIMGHVDHGKTSLLDYIRRSNIIAGEAGGITQHIGAYEVTFNDSQITFLDTPGHEAFTAMRARGAQATDIVILVVAADDGVQQQTLEAISHARAAGVPIIIAINKIDRPSANPDNIRKQLAENDILVESWGGKYQDAEISAKTGLGVDHLLELVLLEAELMELRANPNRLARGLVIESELDKGKGPVATVLIQNGTARVGDPFVAGITFGRIRALMDERGKRIKEAPPSTPVRIIGFSAVPLAGDRFVVMESEKQAREISMKRQQLHREQEMRKVRLKTLDQISRQIREGEVKELNIIVKADVAGSVEAIADSLMKLSTNEVAVNVIHKGVGGISETDVNLAVASNAVILGFNVRVAIQARELAAREDIDIRTYKVIYDAINDVKAALEGMLSPEITESVSATVEVREVFKISRVGTIAGCYVLSGKVKRGDRIRLYREDKLIYEGKLASLKRFKDDVKEVASGFECGIGIEGYDDLHVGDIIECIQVSETKRTLA